MNTWGEFSSGSPELARIGETLLFRTRIGRAFLATLRKDGAPRLHPVSLVIHSGHLYVLIPPASPNCADLSRDGRYALQAFPTNNESNDEFYLAGGAERIQDPAVREALLSATGIYAGEEEILFELLLDRAMHTYLAGFGTADEHPVHQKWNAS